uniref:glutathione transferase n=2 Tax=Calcidiscus leptoporus TaxID=127549 RepID=A0A7S0IWP0_9EUKA|mmetsp:Transcript_25707/g.59981  ORF Transcript_25707/g.59981 Transcript_25707/m.59981 type:complete len:234 (+) Transcript_25707:71-772(+)
MTYEMGYWNIRGLAAPLRMMSAYAGVPIKEQQYDLEAQEGGGWAAPTWFASAKPALQEKNAMINLPYVVDEASGLVITQSTACYTYLGRKFGLMGSTDEQTARVEQTLAQAFDLRNDLMKVVYPFTGVTPETYPAEAAKHLSKTANGHFSKFEGFLCDQYSAGAAPTAGDFHLWEMLDQHVMMAAALSLPSPLESFPKLAALHKALRELPQLQEYFEGPNYKLPCNNKMANFK